MGRPAGSRNIRAHSTEKFVAKVEEMLRAADPGTYGTDPKADTLARVAARLIHTAEDKIKIQVWKTLAQYKYGMPTQPLEHSGEVSYTDTVREMRERVANGKTTS